MLFTLLFLAPLWVAQTPVTPPSGGIAGPKSWEWSYRRVIASNWHPQVFARLTNLQGGKADLYIRYGGKPKHGLWDMRSNRPGFRDEEIILNNTTQPGLQTGAWWIGVWHETGASYQLDSGTETIPSSHSGMGATVLEGGTSFRAWAPYAVEMRVAGDFNGWSWLASPMASEGDGIWSLDVRGVTADGKYRFVIDTGPSDIWKNDPRARKVTSATGNSVIVDPDAFDWSGDNFSMPAWNDLVIYEMHLGTFNPTGNAVGTFNEAQQKLDYLADLGINAIEFMPICEFAGSRSWGYNYGHPFAVESSYGTPEDLKTFVKEAHQRGIAILVDVLYNHWGPTDMDLWRFDGWGPSNYGGVYFYNNGRAVTPWGDTRPNYGVGQVRQFIRDNALSWFREYHMDGLRWDATSYIRQDDWGANGDGWSLMQWVNDEIDQEFGWKINIAEDMWSNHWMTKTTGAGGAGFDSQWDPNFVHPIRNAAIPSGDSGRNMDDVKDSIQYAYNGSAFQRVIFTESHDEVANGKSRVPEEIWPGNADSWSSKKRSTLIAAALMTSPGVPLIFQGQEFLEDGFFDDDDPLDWNKFSTFSGIHQLYKNLIGLRRNRIGFTKGLKGNNTNVHHLNNTNKLVAFHRWDQGGPGDDVIVLLNFSGTSFPVYNIGFPAGGTWLVRFNSDSNVFDSSFGNYGSTATQAYAGSSDGMPYTGSLSIGPYSALILSQ